MGLQLGNPLIDLKKTSGEMIKNGTWKFEKGMFFQALRLKNGETGIVRYDGENFYFPDEWGRRERKEALGIVNFILDLEVDLESFYSEIGDSPFKFLVDEFYGLRVPRAGSPYQALVEVIAQQQVNFEFAQRTINNLVRLAGQQTGGLWVFPDPKDIAALSFEELKKARLGYRAGYIKTVTEQYLTGKLTLDLWNSSVEDAIRYLTKFRGIGRWTAELFLAYGLGKNVYPAGDLGLRRGIAKIFGKSVRDVRERDVREILEPYGVWKGYLAFYVTCYDRKTQLERRRR